MEVNDMKNISLLIMILLMLLEVEAVQRNEAGRDNLNKATLPDSSGYRGRFERRSGWSR
jgi:hypothetical protein